MAKGIKFMPFTLSMKTLRDILFATELHENEMKVIQVGKE